MARAPANAFSPSRRAAEHREDNARGSRTPRSRTRPRRGKASRIRPPVPRSPAPRCRPPRRTAPTGSAQPTVAKLMRRPVSVLRSRNVSWNPVRLRDAAIVEVLVFVLERQVPIEPHRSQVGEVLDLVRRVDPCGDGREGQQEQANQKEPLAPRDVEGRGARGEGRGIVHWVEAILARPPAALRRGLARARVDQAASGGGHLTHPTSGTSPPAAG